jgi:hypothetical protein
MGGSSVSLLIFEWLSRCSLPVMMISTRHVIGVLLGIALLVLVYANHVGWKRARRQRQQLQQLALAYYRSQTDAAGTPARSAIN